MAELDLRSFDREHNDEKKIADDRCRVSGDASMLALTKLTLADFAIPHGEPDPEEEVFANAAGDNLRAVPSSPEREP